MSIHTLMIFSTQQHHYLTFQRGRRRHQVAAPRFTVHLHTVFVLVCLCYVFPSPPYTSPVHLPSLALPPPAPNTTSPATLHHLLPLWSVSLPQDLSSDWDGMFQGYTLPSANEFLKPIYGASYPPMPLPPCLSLSLLHLCTSSSSSSSSSVSPLVVCLFSNWSHISSPVCRNDSMPCSPLPSTPALSPPSTFLCQAQPPPLTSTLPQRDL